MKWSLHFLIAYLKISIWLDKRELNHAVMMYKIVIDFINISKGYFTPDDS